MINIKLKTNKVYLAGSMQFSPSSEYGMKWRIELIPKLVELGLEGIAPPEAMKRKIEEILEENEKMKGWIRSGNRELFLKTFEKRWVPDIKAITDSDFLIVYKPVNDIITVGTDFECWDAYLKRKPILLINPEPFSEESFALLYIVLKNGELFKSFGEVLQYIKENKKYWVDKK